MPSFAGEARAALGEIFKVQIAADAPPASPMLMYNKPRTKKTFIHADAPGFQELHNAVSSQDVKLIRQDHLTYHRSQLPGTSQCGELPACHFDQTGPSHIAHSFEWLHDMLRSSCPEWLSKIMGDSCFLSSFMNV